MKTNKSKQQKMNELHEKHKQLVEKGDIAGVAQICAEIHLLAAEITHETRNARTPKL